MKENAERMEEWQNVSAQFVSSMNDKTSSTDAFNSAMSVSVGLSRQLVTALRSVRVEHQKSANTELAAARQNLADVKASNPNAPQMKAPKSWMDKIFGSGDATQREWLQQQKTDTYNAQLKAA